MVEKHFWRWFHQVDLKKQNALHQQAASNQA
jgi:hypothetical protein